MGIMAFSLQVLGAPAKMLGAPSNTQKLILGGTFNSKKKSFLFVKHSVAHGVFYKSS